MDFTHSDLPQPHPARRKQLLKAHPELSKLTGPYTPTAFILLGVVAAQFALAAWAATLPWWQNLIVAWTLGAALAHALYVLIHECTHNLVARTVPGNKVYGIVANLPTVLPSAISFRKYHLLHHAHQGNPDLDADLPSAWEERLVGNSALRKTLWLLFFAVFQALRPMRLKGVKLWDRWTVLNFVVSLATNVAVWMLLGPWALFYLTMATLFGLGLHPLGGRWIQEHFVTTPGQETYSYYGAANLIALNVGYHNEHHDMMNVPWIHLPKLTAAAPELYDGLASYRSWTALVGRFLFDRRLAPASRIVRGGPKTSTVA